MCLYFIFVMRGSCVQVTFSAPFLLFDFITFFHFVSFCYNRHKMTKRAIKNAQIQSRLGQNLGRCSRFVLYHVLFANLMSRKIRSENKKSSQKFINRIFWLSTNSYNT